MPDRVASAEELRTLMRQRVWMRSMYRSEHARPSELDEVGYAHYRQGRADEAGLIDEELSSIDIVEGPARVTREPDAQDWDAPWVMRCDVCHVTEGAAPRFDDVALIALVVRHNREHAQQPLSRYSDAAAGMQVLADASWLIDRRDEYGTPVQAEISAARELVKILYGNRDAAVSWLPARHWDEWETRRNEQDAR